MASKHLPARAATTTKGASRRGVPCNGLGDTRTFAQKLKTAQPTHLMCTLDMDSCRLPITVSITAFSMPPTPPPPPPPPACEGQQREKDA